jgi:hypothetical protein
MLLGGWRQVGPVTLRTSVAQGTDHFSSLYLPVFVAGYRRRAIRALSGSFEPQAESVDLKVNGYPAGKIHMPSPGGVQGANAISLGAGNLTLIDGAENVDGPVDIGYDQLTPLIPSVTRMLEGDPNPVDRVDRQAPFNFPDVLRIPLQADGFVALHKLRGGADETFSQRFLQRMRGAGAVGPPVLPQGQQAPCLVQDANQDFFVGTDQSGHLFYIERFRGCLVEELSLLGCILWKVFSGEAEVHGETVRETATQFVLLSFSGRRLEMDSSVRPDWPSVREKMATLQRLAGAIAGQGVHPLFHVAVERWLSNVGENIAPMSGPMRQMQIGQYVWYTV